MSCFLQFIIELHTQNKTPDQVQTITTYLEQASDEEAAWITWLLLQPKTKRVISDQTLIQATCQFTDLDHLFNPSLIQSCRKQASNLSETIALLIVNHYTPQTNQLSTTTNPFFFHQLMQNHIKNMVNQQPDQQIQIIHQLWTSLLHPPLISRSNADTSDASDTSLILIKKMTRLHQFLLGRLKLNAQDVLTCALASLSQTSVDTMTQRLMQWLWQPSNQPTPALYQQLFEKTD